MVNKYIVDDTKIYNEEALMRASTLSVSSKRQSTIAKSLDRRFMDEGVFDTIISNSNIINEVYLDFTPDQIINYIDHPDKYQTYLKKNSMYLDRGALNVFFINLRMLSVQKLNAKHIIFLNDILTQGPNDIYVMPSIQFDKGDRYSKMKFYSDFVSNMITCKNSRAPGSLNLGITVPSFYGHKDMEDLFKLYSNENAEPTFVSVDFKGSNIEDTKRMKVVDALNAHYAAEDTEDFFLYGLNLRSYKSGPSNPVSEEMLIARSGLNAVGAPHRAPGGRGGSKITQIEKLGAIFDPADYCFHYLSEQDQKERFCDWAFDRGYRFDIDNNMTKDAYKIMSALKKFNLVKENEEFFSVSNAIRKNDTDLIKDMLVKGNVPPSSDGERDPSQRTLDSF